MKYLMMFMIALNVYSYTGWSSYEPENKSRKSITYTFKNTHKDAFHIRKYADGTWILQVGSTEKIKSNASVIFSMDYGDTPVMLTDVFKKDKNDVFFVLSEEDVERLIDVFFDAEMYQDMATFEFFNGMSYTEVRIDCTGFKNMYRKMYED